MEKKRFQQLFRTFMRSHGFTVKGNNSYLLLDESYMVTVCLDHQTIRAAYFVEFGVVYNPTEDQIPFRGLGCHWSDCFHFGASEDVSLEKYPLEKMLNGILYDGSYDPERVRYFEYENRSEQNLLTSLEINFQKKVTQLFDREFVLNLYRNDWKLFRSVPARTVEIIAQLAGLDVDRAMEEQHYSIWPKLPK